MRTILKDDVFLKEAKQVLAAPLVVPSGDIRQEFLFSSKAFSNWLGLKLEDVIKSFPDWKETGPILLGSWARGEICLKSDIDLLFCGQEEKVIKLVSYLNEQGYKIRYRMPQDMQDWTQGVEAFDVLSLLKARPLTAEAATKLSEQQQKILLKRSYFAKVILKEVIKERKIRANRFDSITSFLEPNIKYGPGGLRDIEQALQIYELFSDKIPSPAHTLNVLNYYKSYLLSIRQKLHLDGLGDVLVSTSQVDIAQWMGFKSYKIFMHDLQRGLSRSHFYSEWILQVAQVSAAKMEQVDRVTLKSVDDFFKALKKDPGVLMQKRVREKMDLIFTDKTRVKISKKVAVFLGESLLPQKSDELLVSIFISRLIDKLLPAIRHLVGYVQHDQYHRFTADSHILQACREIKRVYQKKSELGALKKIGLKLNKYDWEVLKWTALYHDLAKGLESDDHSGVGVEILKKDFKLYGFSKKMTEDVAWLVENHLELSQAAFRKNAKSLSLWQQLRDKGVVGKNLYRLAVFTAVDIRATNPEAWNDWKSRLLKELVDSLESKNAQNYFDFSEAKKRKRLKLDVEVFEQLDSLLVESISAKVLVDDLKKAEESESNLKPLVYAKNKKDIWIRMHQKRDRAGILATYVSQLYSLGVSVRHASIHTLSKVGVYDWFQVSSQKNAEVLQKLLANSNFDQVKIPEVYFENIEFVSRDEKEWVLSFKGQDRPGMLAAAAMALAEQDICIKSARVHTWGRQVEDVFIVKPKGDSDLLLKALHERLLRASEVS